MVAVSRSEPVLLWMTRRIPRAAGFTLAGIALIAQQAMLWWLYYGYGPKRLAGDEVRYWNTAHDILAGGPWHPSDLWPPAQPLFIALIVALRDSVVAVQIVQMLLFFGCAFLLWDLWRRVSASSTAAAIAAGLFLLSPSAAAFAQYLWPEVTHLFVVLAALDLLLARRAGAKAALLAGVCVGLALLFKSVLTPFWPLLLLAFVAQWRPLRVRWLPTLLFLVALALTVAPAVVAGHRNTGHWAIADSSAYNVMVGLGVPQRNDWIALPQWTPFEDYMASGTTPDARNAWAWRQVVSRLESEGVATVLWRQLDKQYYRLFESKTLLLGQLQGPACAGYIGAYPDTPRWLALTVRWTSHLFHALILAGCAFGLFLQRDWRRPALWLLLAYVAYQLALFVGVLAIARYLLTLTPVLCGFAGDAYARLIEPRSDPVSARRLVGGALLAALLLWFAFAGPFIDGYCR